MATLPHDVMGLTPGSRAAAALLYHEYVSLPQARIVPSIEAILASMVPDALTDERAAVGELAEGVVRDLAGNIYHCSEHPLHVALGAAILLRRTPWLQDRRLALLLLLAALGHDYGWRGDEQSKDYFFLERRAAEATAEVMRCHGFSDKDVRDVSLLILATSPLYRREIMMVADASEWGGLHLLSSVLKLPSDLAPLSEDPKLAMLAGIISDADLFFSIALGEPAHVEMTRRVFEEQDFYANRPFRGVDPSKVRDFFMFVCTDTFASAAGSHFAESLEDLWGRAVGTRLDLRSNAMSKRLRTRSPFERERIRRFLFEALGGWPGYRKTVRVETTGHVVFMKEDRCALVVTRSGLCLSGQVRDGGIHIEKAGRPGFGRLA